MIKYYCEDVEPEESEDTPPVKPVESEEEVLPEDEDLEEIEEETGEKVGEEKETEEVI